MPNVKTGTDPHQDSHEHLIRPRINEIFMQAIKKPLVIVCAGTGYGKTRAVYDFTIKSGIPTTWLQLSAHDNISTRFWENFVHAFVLINKLLTDELKELGFPDTEDKFKRFLIIRNSYMDDDPNRLHLYVVDDFHLIHNPNIIRFWERVTNDWPEGRSLILICRNLPEINILNMQAAGLVQNISEEALAFTETELAEYFNRQKLSVDLRTMDQILQDTNGWAFSLNLIARALQKTDSYMGYVRNAIRQNIFNLMESEIWKVISEKLKHFLQRLLLIEHLSSELVVAFADGEESLITELQQQNAYIRFDGDIDVYLIHHLFKEFLHTKQSLLTDEEKQKTYQIAAKWCEKNEFIVDALNYYEKSGDYERIAAILSEAPRQLMVGVAHLLKGIFDRTPKDVFDRVEWFAPMHIRIMMSLGRLQETVELMKDYEKKFLALPEDDAFRNRMMGVIYHIWGVVRLLLCTEDDCYDFDQYFEKMNRCLTKSPVVFHQSNHPVGPWISPVGSARPGALQESIDALSRSVSYVQQSHHGWMSGEDDLARGELLFYQGDISGAESFMMKALDEAQSHGQFEITHGALFYIMRIAAVQGNHAKLIQAIKDVEKQLEHKEYYERFFSYDIAQGWYYYLLRMPENVPNWLKGKFMPCFHPILHESFGNQMKLRYHYLTKNYPLLLAYIEEQKKQTQILFGRVELLAIEACMRYQIKDRPGAFVTLRDAYETASSNNIIMPFIELGRDMRTLITSALRTEVSKIPRSWLELINRKANYYAKNQVLVITAFEKAANINANIILSVREQEVLRDLYNGFSQTEIADKLDISSGTVKMIYKRLSHKLNARSIADIIRVAVEQKLV